MGVAYVYVFVFVCSGLCAHGHWVSTLGINLGDNCSGTYFVQWSGNVEVTLASRCSAGHTSVLPSHVWAGVLDPLLLILRHNTGSLEQSCPGELRSDGRVLPMNPEAICHT
jgi:hypothetical protein